MTVHVKISDNVNNALSIIKYKKKKKRANGIHTGLLKQEYLPLNTENLKISISRLEKAISKFMTQETESMHLLIY